MATNSLEQRRINGENILKRAVEVSFSKAALSPEDFLAAVVSTLDTSSLNSLYFNLSDLPLIPTKDRAKRIQDRISPHFADVKRKYHIEAETFTALVMTLAKTEYSETNP